MSNKRDQGKAKKDARKASLVRLMFDNIPQYLLELFCYSDLLSLPPYPPVDIEIIAIVNALLNRTYGGSAGANFWKQRARCE